MQPTCSLNVRRTVCLMLCAFALMVTACTAEVHKVDLLLRDVTVFDANTGRVNASQSIFIHKGIITEIRQSKSEDTADNIIEGKGRLLTPGLIDTHAHFMHQFFHTRNLQKTDRERLARVYLTHGVTTVADMGQPPAWVPELVNWESRPASDSPNIVLVAGSLGTQHEWDTRPPPHHVLLSSPEEARLQVKTYHSAGAQRLKLYWKLERPEMQAIIEEADRFDLSYFGHIDNGFVLIQSAMDDGLRDFEHFFTLQRSIEDPDTFIDMMNKEFGFQGHQNMDEWTLSLALYHDMIERTPELKVRFNDLLDRMANERVSVSTTLNMLVSAGSQSPVYSSFNRAPLKTGPNIRDDYVSETRSKEAIASLLTQMKRAHDKGVSLRTGTDARNGGQVTLAELILLAEAGFTVEDVLQIVTINGARALGIEHKAGLIAVGRSADLVLFHKSPLDDPENFKEGMTVIKNGEVYQPTQSPARELAKYLSEGSNRTLEIWLTENESLILHPTEVSDEIFRQISNGDFKIAEGLYEAMSASVNGENPSDYISENTLITLGYDLLAKGKSSEAIKLFEITTKIFPDSWNAHDSLGEAQLSAGNLIDARESYSRSLAINPASPTGQDAIKKLDEAR